MSTLSTCASPGGEVLRRVWGQAARRLPCLWAGSGTHGQVLPGVRHGPGWTATERGVPGAGRSTTALFADIKGAMALLEDLDPEAARDLIDPALRLMMDAVHRYEGYVAQSL